MEEPENVSPVMLGTGSVQQSLIVVVTEDSVSQVVSDLLIQFCYLLLVEFQLKFGSFLRHFRTAALRSICRVSFSGQV